MQQSVRIKNASDSIQTFVGYPPFQPGDIRDVPQEDAEILLRSPFIERADEEPRKPQKARGVSSDRSVKGIERE